MTHSRASALEVQEASSKDSCLRVYQCSHNIEVLSSVLRFAIEMCGAIPIEVPQYFYDNYCSIRFSNEQAGEAEGQPPRSLRTVF